MAVVWNKTTGELIVSVNTPDYDPIDWIIDPDFAAVLGQPQKYWRLNTNPVELLTVPEQQAVDAAIDAAILQSNRDEALRRRDVDISTRATFGELAFQLEKAFKRIQELQDSLTAIKNTSGGSDNIRGAIPGPSNVSNPAPANFTRVPPDLPRSDLMQGYVDRVNSGSGDPA